MYHETLTTPRSPLDNELRALIQEKHSPSSAMIHAALLIAARTEIGYGDIYTVIPRAQSEEYASMAATEMEARCPFLLAAIRDAIAANRTRISVEVLHDPPRATAQNPVLSAHARLTGLPRLIAWLLGAAPS